jgi:hypothetical protein
MGNTLAQEIEVVPRLRAGDEFSLKMIRTRENSSRPQHDGKSTTVVVVRVVEATPEGLTLDWTPGPTSFENPKVAGDPVLLAAAAAMRDINLRLNLNAEGEFSGLANEKEILPRLEAGVEVIIRELTNKIPEEQRKNFQSMVAAVLSPALLIASATREAQMYFGLNGASLAVGEAVEVGIEQPNPLGGDPVPARWRVLAESATKTSVVIKTTTTYDSAALMRLTRALLEKGGQVLSEEELAKAPPLTMEDEGQYVFDRKTGLMREAVVKRRLKAGNVQRFDGWEIRLVKAPKR